MKLFIKEEGNPAVGCWNAFMIMALTALVIAGGFALVSGLLHHEEPAEDTEELVFIPPLDKPVLGRADELSWQLRGEEGYCLELLPPEVSEEPDYELRSGEECEG